MMPRIIAICCAISMWSPFFLNSAKAQDDLIKCNIRDGQNEIHLELRKTEQFLANQHMPVWSAKYPKRTHFPLGGTVTNELIPDFVKDEIGHFIFYHDKKKSAAVVLFTRTGMLVGTVDTRYHIVALPIQKCIPGVNVGHYVKRIECDSMDPEHHRKPLDQPVCHHKVSEHCQSTSFVPADNEPITYFYPEIMVFIPHDVTYLLKKRFQENYLLTTIMQSIVYFNAVDMLISKLSTENVGIRINLAGIILEEQEHVFNFFEPYHPDPRYIDVFDTIHRFHHYVSRNSLTFTQDSFDFFFIPTSNMLIRADVKHIVEGFSWTRQLFEIRRDHSTATHWVGSVVHSTTGYEYITAAHEIAHLMHINHDPANKGYCKGRTQCYAIMQEINKYCLDCLKWSDESVTELKKFSTQNRDRCFLLNHPRSLHPFGTRIRTLSPADQCRCYGIEPQTSIEGAKRFDVISHAACGQSLNCGKDAENMRLPIPIDGTPCDNNGVCWDGICKPIWIAP